MMVNPCKIFLLTFLVLLIAKLWLTYLSASMKRKGESGSNSWTDLLENPNQWWDYRSSKRSGLVMIHPLGKFLFSCWYLWIRYLLASCFAQVKPKHPDFKHKNNNQSVWLTGAPSWIFSGLEKVKFDVKTALPTQTKQQKGTNNLATILKLPSPGLPKLHPLKLAYLAMWMLIIFLCQYVLVNMCLENNSHGSHQMLLSHVANGTMLV